MKKLLIGLLALGSVSTFASGIRCLDGYAYYENASDRPTIIIHSKSQNDNDITITGVGAYQIKGNGKMTTGNDGTSTLVANNLKDRKGNKAKLEININRGNSTTVLETATETIKRDFFCTGFSWR